MSLRRLAGVVIWVTMAALVDPCLSGQPEAPFVDEESIDEYMKQRLKKDKYPSLSVGVVHDQNLVFSRAYGVANRESKREATPDTIYFIGSITKVFTTTLMCMLRDEGMLRLDDPVAQYLPDSVALPSDPRGAPAITLRHLATHSSGLPKLPPNLTPAEGDPYNAYGVEQLYAGLGQVELIHPTGAEYSYSNLGVGLLGHALERATGQPYEEMLRSYLLEPLGMKNTAWSVSGQHREVFAKGYTGDDFQKEAPEWDVGCLVPAGGLASSVTDLARFLSLQLRAGQPNVEPVSGGTLNELHTPQRLAAEWNLAVGLGWHVVPSSKLEDDVVWHNGGVAGHFAFIGFLPQHKIGVIVLINGSKFVDEIGHWLLETAAESCQPTSLTSEELPSGERILENYVAATGGAKAYDGCHNMVQRGKGNLAGMPVTYETYHATPARYYMKMQMGQTVLLEQGTDGETAWGMSPMAGASVTTGEERDVILREAFFHQETRWGELYTAARCTGITEYEGHRCFKVDLAARRGPEETRYYDVKSHLLVGREMAVKSADLGNATIRTEVIYDDYREFDGILRPCKIVTKLLGQEISFTVESVEHNAEIPPNRFDIPPAVRKLQAK